VASHFQLKMRHLLNSTPLPFNYSSNPIKSDIKSVQINSERYLNLVDVRIEKRDQDIGLFYENGNYKDVCSISGPSLSTSASAGPVAITGVYNPNSGDLTGVGVGLGWGTPKGITATIGNTGTLGGSIPLGAGAPGQVPSPFHAP
jgi:hypothetical protein